MRRVWSPLLMVGLVAGADVACAQDLLNTARDEVTTRSEAAVRLVDVASASTSTGPQAPVATAFTVDSSATSRGPLGGNWDLPAAVRPWGWSWFPYYQCATAFWRGSNEGGVTLSPLEKLDTFAYNRGSQLPYAAVYEAADARPWVAQQRGWPAGHNLAPAVAEAGGRYGNQHTIQWYQAGQDGQYAESTMNVSWWGHCNGWAAAAVSFAEDKLGPRTINLAKGELNYLKRPPYIQAASSLQEWFAAGNNGAPGHYERRPAASMRFLTPDLKSVLAEFGMQLKMAPAFIAGRRYDAPSVEIEETYFDRRPDGSVIIPQDATFTWVALVWDGQIRNGWQIPRGYPEENLRQWRQQVEQYYRYYYPQARISTQLVARFANLPLEPTAESLRDLPSLVRKAYLDSAPMDVHEKVQAAFSGSSGGRHGLIVETSTGSQVWNYPMQEYSFNIGAIQDTRYSAGATYAGRHTNDPSILFNLVKLDASRLPASGSNRNVRYRRGTMNMTLQSPNGEPDVHSYEFVAFYDSSDRAMGSCWSGTSLTNHPDFVWYPDLDSAPAPERGNPYVSSADLKVLCPDLPIR